MQSEPGSLLVGAPALLFLPIHPTSWKKNSANFAGLAFSEVRLQDGLGSPSAGTRVVGVTAPTEGRELHLPFPERYRSLPGIHKPLMPIASASKSATNPQLSQGIFTTPRGFDEVLGTLLQERPDVGGPGQAPLVLPTTRAHDDRLRAHPLFQDPLLRRVKGHDE